MIFANPLLTLAAWTARRLPMPVKQQLYRMPVLTRLVRTTLNRAAPQGLTIIRVAAGGLAGYPLQLDLQREKDYWLGIYEPDLQAAIAEFVHPGMVVYDVGANIGYISLLCASKVAPGGQVFAFEPLPANLERLKSNLNLNELGQLITIAPYAVIDAPRPVRFLVGPSGGMGKAEGSAGRVKYSYADAVATQGISLDHFAFEMKNPLPQLVKMDIEGGEVLALPGMQQLLEAARPLMILELHGSEAAAATWEVLSGAGYRLCQLKPGYPPIASAQALGWKAYLIGFPPESSLRKP